MIDSENETGNIVTYEDDDNEEYGIEIKGKNVVKLNADKVLVKTPLLTTAQDLAGAINELFQGGSGETPADSDYEKWLSLPEPADNQAVFLVRAVEGYMSCSINAGLPYDYVEQAEGWSVDWGDGTIETFINWRTSASHTYATAGEYTVTITNICGDNTYAVSSGTQWIMAKYGDNVYVDKVIGGTSGQKLSSEKYLRYVRLSPDTDFSENFFSSDYSLRKIEFNGTLSAVPGYCFYNCANLKEFDLSKCTSIGNYAFGYCYSLEKAQAPLCTQVGDSAFRYCYRLMETEFSESCTFGEKSFDYCYALYPKPDGSA